MKYSDLYEEGKEQAKAEGKKPLQLHKAAEDYMWSQLDEATKEALQEEVEEIKTLGEKKGFRQFWKGKFDDTDFE